MKLDRVHSYSSLSSYEWCKQKYKYSYVDKLDSGIKSPHLIKGGDIHELFQNYYKGFEGKITKENIDKQRLLIPTHMYLKYKSHIDNFFAFNKRIFESIHQDELGTKFLPICVEEEFVDEMYNIKGFIDAVYEDNNGNIVILDFKTGKYPKDNKISASYQKQLYIYVHLWNLHHPDKPAKFIAHFYTIKEPDKNNPIILKVDSNKLNETRKWIIDTQKKINSGEFTKCSDLYKCKKCEFYMNCYGGVIW